ncbi:unnamed protein product, partial [Adineta steineri]
MASAKKASGNTKASSQTKGGSPSKSRSSQNNNSPNKNQSNSPKKTNTNNKNRRAGTTTSSHPTYQRMVTEALQTLNSRSGSSRSKIMNHIRSSYGINSGKIANSHLRSALEALLEDSVISLAKGTGYSNGYYRISAKGKKASTKKSSSSSSKKTSGRRSSSASSASRSRSRKRSQSGDRRRSSTNSNSQSRSRSPSKSKKSDGRKNNKPP